MNDENKPIREILEEKKLIEESWIDDVGIIYDILDPGHDLTYDDLIKKIKHLRDSHDSQFCFVCNPPLLESFKNLELMSCKICGASMLGTEKTKQEHDELFHKER